MNYKELSVKFLNALERQPRATLMGKGLSRVSLAHVIVPFPQVV